MAKRKAPSVRFSVNRDALADVLGSKEVTPADIMKKLSAHVRTHELTLPQNHVKVDAALAAALNTSKKKIKRTEMIQLAYKGLTQIKK